MNTTLITAGAAAIRPRPASTWLERLTRRAGTALLAWSTRVEHRHSREYLMELHERRIEAERLRDERFGYATFARII